MSSPLPSQTVEWKSKRLASIDGVDEDAGPRNEDLSLMSFGIECGDVDPRIFQDANPYVARLCWVLTLGVVLAIGITLLRMSRFLLKFGGDPGLVQAAA